MKCDECGHYRVNHVERPGGLSEPCDECPCPDYVQPPITL